MNEDKSTSDTVAGQKVSPNFDRSGHVGDIVVPDDDRRPYVVLHPNFRREHGEPKTPQEHSLKRAFVRGLQSGFADEESEFTQRRYGRVRKFNAAA
ncbi:hypothetical protein ACQPXH_19115 [Nocardia sp. CA-135953]|uniref:hypothetical protein n=1 Tax=Nocardia sp. CA-135953 TaxID=3239978 RepID=UPI003D96DA98